MLGADNSDNTLLSLTPLADDYMFGAWLTQAPSVFRALELTPNADLSEYGAWLWKSLPPV